MSRVVIVCADDWEGLFIDGFLIDESHKLGEGYHRVYLLRKAEQYKFTSLDVEERFTDEKEEEWLEDRGGFPDTLQAFDKIGK